MLCQWPALLSADHLRARSTARQFGADINAQFVTTQGVLRLWARPESRPASCDLHELEAVTGALRSMTLSSRLAHRSISAGFEYCWFTPAASLWPTPSYLLSALRPLAR